MVPARLHAPLATAAVAVAGCAAVAVADPTTPGGISPVCPTRALLGIDCPLCGTLRAVHALLHLDPAAALRFNAVGVLGLLLLALGWVSWTVGAATGRPVLPAAGVAGLRRGVPVVLAAWFVVRLLPWAPFTALRV
ncbi:DUF2752 domain-containing protein [Rhodococcus aerolatus]